MITLTRATAPSATRDRLIIIDRFSDLAKLGAITKDRKHLEAQLKENATMARSERDGQMTMVHLIEKGPVPTQLEKARRAGAKMLSQLERLKRKETQVIGLARSEEHVLALVEGVALASYRFHKYFTDGKGATPLKRLSVIHAEVSKVALDELADVCEATWLCRDLVNEPVSFLTAEQLSSELKTMSANSGFKLQVFNKKKIEALRMGGLLAVNKGSLDPPTFNIMEWKPKNAVNKAPILLVGKGVVYDTGGLSLKPTPNSMDLMKCDMAGSAAVAGAMYAIARRQLPVHVVALIAATDNRPGGNAYAPGDVITMHNGMTVEVLNTDAEGRITLADAISYGNRYKPELIVDMATLTGAAARAIGVQGVVAMGTASEKEFKRLESAGAQVHERIARFPFWDEYDDELKSPIADMKNLGGAEGGAITAGKFLARYTDFPLIHLDIAGPAFIPKADAYRTKGSSGVGVRLLYDMVKRRAAE